MMPEYPGRLYHNTPGWVRDDALFHVRLRADPTQSSLVDPELAAQLLQAVLRYHELGHWWCELFLLMPDHAHLIVSFPRAPGLTTVIRNWKRGTSRFQKIRWQEGFFDHRLRSDPESNEKWHYIRRNPVVKNLCVAEDAWPWWWSAMTQNPLLAGGAA